jgi:hypothetical protein
MTDLAAGDTLVCDESRAEEPRHDFGSDYTGLGPRFVHFRALVDRVQDDYVEATVTMRNPHLKAPDPGAELALSAATIAADPRWRLA